MTPERQKQLAETFRQAHRPPPLLLLPNAWDAMSARQFEAAGFGAVATTSGGVAWSLGFPDGESAPWPEGVAAVINARVDLYIKNVGDPASRFDETVRRGKAYLAAGADCIYPFGLAEVEVIERLVKALGHAPVNIVARPDTSTAALERIGV